MLLQRRLSCWRICLMICILAVCLFRRVVVVSAFGDSGSRGGPHRRRAGGVRGTSSTISTRALNGPIFDDDQLFLDGRLPQDDDDDGPTPPPKKDNKTPPPKDPGSSSDEESEAPSIQPSAAPVFQNQPSRSGEINSLSLGENEFAKARDPSETPGIALLAGVAGGGLVLIFLVVILVTRGTRRRNKYDEEAVEVDRDYALDDEDNSTINSIITLSRREMKEHEMAPQPFDLSGEYKMVEHHNMDSFLEAAGVPWAIRSAATRALSKHSIVHKGNLFTMKFKGIPRVTYVIGGPTVESMVRDSKFDDTVSYTKNKGGVQMIKQPVGCNYRFRLTWCVVKAGGSEIVLTSTAHYKDGRKPVEAVQRYRRVQ